MTYQEIKEKEAAVAALAWRFQELKYELEETGEVNPEMDEVQKQFCEAASELAVNGTDSLGHWQVSVENELKTLKAEKAAIDRRIKAANNTLEFVKDTLTNLLKVTGQEKVKGTLYSYKLTKSVTTKVDTDEVDRLYMPQAEAAVREAGLPCYITVKLEPKVSLVPEGEDLPEIFIVNEKDTVRFTKPRGGKE